MDMNRSQEHELGPSWILTLGLNLLVVSVVVVLVTIPFELISSSDLRLDRLWSEHRLVMPFVWGVCTLVRIWDRHVRRLLALAYGFRSEVVGPNRIFACTIPISAAGASVRVIEAGRFLEENFPDVVIRHVGTLRAEGCVGKFQATRFLVESDASDAARVIVRSEVSGWIALSGFDMRAVLVVIVLAEGVLGGLPFSQQFRYRPDAATIMRRARERITGRTAGLTEK